MIARQCIQLIHHRRSRFINAGVAIGRSIAPVERSDVSNRALIAPYVAIEHQARHLERLHFRGAPVAEPFGKAGGQPRRAGEIFFPGTRARCQDYAISVALDENLIGGEPEPLWNPNRLAATDLEDPCGFTF